MEECRDSKMEISRSPNGKTKKNEISNSTPMAPRQSLKSNSEFNNCKLWKQKLRENCYKRVRDERTRLLWKLRSQSPNQQDDHLDVEFRDIVSCEFNKIFKHSSPHDKDRNRDPDYDNDDLLWDDEGPHTTYQGDYQEILLEMQNIFYKDLKSQPPILGQETSIDTWEDEVDDYLARAVYEHMQLNADKVCREKIWCPVCKHGELQDIHSLIYCTSCELKLTKASELTLDFLRDRLAEVHMEHLDRGCSLKPRFCIQSKFNLTALYISCEGCDTFEVVF